MRGKAIDVSNFRVRVRVRVKTRSSIQQMMLGRVGFESTRLLRRCESESADSHSCIGGFVTKLKIIEKYSFIISTPPMSQRGQLCTEVTRIIAGGEGQFITSKGIAVFFSSQISAARI